MAWNVDVALKTSAVHGNGVFVRERVPAGAKVWQFDPSMHVCDRDAMARLAPETITFALHGGYLHVPSGLFLWYEDGMEFLNHGGEGTANVGLDHWPALGDDHLIALRDIEPGEELLEDYGFCLGGGLATDHWLYPLYMDHHPAHHAFLIELRDARRAAPPGGVVLYGGGRKLRTVDNSASSISGLERTASKPDARHAA